MKLHSIHCIDAELLQVGTFSPGFGPIFLDEISCNGEEERINQCPRLSPVPKCFHSQDVGIKCKRRIWC